MKYKFKKGQVKSFLKRLHINQAGVAFIEFAFVMPIITLITVGTLEIGMTMISTILLEGAISEASRSGMTGYVADGKTREEYINDLLVEKTFGMIDLSNLVVHQKVYEDFGDVGLPEPFTDTDADGSYTPGIDSYADMNCNDQWDSEVGTDGIGGPGEVVLYEATYDANFMTGFFSKMISDEDGKIRLTASTVIQNEPYGTPAPGCVVEEKT
ncbi:MAG: pilus assembly protein [Emcibacter sp.]|nr:pilus assembly protein [Emcibacter sp.]